MPLPAPNEGMSRQAATTPVRATTRRRAPPRRLPVTTQATDSGLTLADRVALDRTAAKDLNDGVRYLHGRKPKNLTKENGPEKQLPPRRGRGQRRPRLGEAHFMEEGDADSESDLGDNDSWLDESDDDDALPGENGYLSEDTHYNYPYNLDRMLKSTPLRGPIVINDTVVQAVFDLGASVSVISKSLADKLNLRPNGDRMPLTTIEATSRRMCDVTVSVPVRVAGKLRPEHMCIQPNADRDLCLLGMTWFKAYGIRPDPAGTIYIPTKHGRGYAELKVEVEEVTSESGEDDDEFIGSIFAVAARGQDVDSIPRTQTQPDLENHLEDIWPDGEKEEDQPEPPEGVKQLLEQHAGTFFENAGLGRVQVAEHYIPMQEDPIPTRLG
ncbi:hypothetical protein BCR43DRAFT_505746 [Syncephalastrum racemosum]|uniref:Aspartic peptidase domain-containing protein n=1 Tax=Syncephalastrum racemosum TaxID=13706 RepID=A0A1X2HF76_SYNRA|nr:hypothetical protein BCR43DRAFT_505746 [Syncephalastrum racemosum]